MLVPRKKEKKKHSGPENNMGLNSAGLYTHGCFSATRSADAELQMWRDPGCRGLTVDPPWISECAEGRCPFPCVVQGSAAFSHGWQVSYTLRLNAEVAESDGPLQSHH